MGLHALYKNTAQLPDIQLSAESPLIGRNTRDCITSGAVYGNAAMLDGMVQRIQDSLPEKAAVIVTGGSAGSIIPVCRTEVIFEPELLILGLFGLYERAFI